MQRVCAGVLGAVLWLRVGVDLVAEVPLGPLSLGRWMGLMTAAALLITFVALGLRDPRQRALSPSLRVALGVFAVGVALAAIRASSPLASLRFVALALTPWLCFAVGRGSAGARDVDGWARGLLVVAAVPLGADAWAWWMDEWQVVNGIPRLVGAYSDPHPHATALWVFSTAACWTALRERGPWRWGALVVLGMSGVALALTWVRTVQLMAVIAVAGWAIHQRRWAPLVALGVAAAVALGVSPTLRGRFADALLPVQVLMGEGDLQAFGSHRGHIWSDVVAGMIERGPLAWLGGLGAGFERTLHRNLDPHSDLLSLWVQGGLAALLGWVAAVVATAVRAGPKGSVERSFAVALMASTLVAAAASNDVWNHALLCAWTWALWGALQEHPGTGGSGQRDGQVVVESA